MLKVGLSMSSDQTIGNSSVARAWPDLNLILLIGRRTYLPRLQRSD